MIIDAKNMIAGRLGARAAKHALLGEQVVIVNSEKAVISGSPKQVLARYKQRSDRGVPKKGPFLHRAPDRFLRRMIRGMLPHKKARGREAFKRIKCYIGIPEEFSKQKTVSFKEAGSDKLPTINRVTVGRVCRHLGGKWYEPQQGGQEKSQVKQDKKD